MSASLSVVRSSSPTTNNNDIFLYLWPRRSASFSFAQKDSDYVHVPSLSKPLSRVIEAGPVPCDLRLPLFPLASFDHMKRRSDHMEDPGARHENPNVAMGSQHMIPLSATTWRVNLKR